jgi:RecB family exonuclease
MLRRFYARERSRLPQRVPIAIEASFNELYGPHQIKGRIDLVLQSEAGEVEIVDFKTSKPSSPSINKPAESMQLFLYDRVWRERDPHASPRVAFYALRHLDDKGFATASDWSDGQELGLTHDEASSEPLRLRIDGLLAGMLANQFQPLPSDDACNVCRCRWLCPEG